MDKLPFSVYDFFGYLAAGFVVLVAADAAFLGGSLTHREPGLVDDFLLVVLAYVAGQVISTAARVVLERTVLRRGLGLPSDRLFEEWTSCARHLFPGYAEMLPAGARRRVLDRSAKEAHIDETGEDLFLHCHARVRRDPVMTERLETFLKLHAFCRNMTLASVITAALLLVGLVCDDPRTGPLSQGVWIVIALVAAVGMFYRWLRFYRHYAVEVFTGYVELPVPPAER
jgi:hypothetical protein